MNEVPAPAWLTRFLAPRHALAERRGLDWQTSGTADTPAADATCRLYLACAHARINQAAFAAFGPPVVIGCADWACEWLIGRTIEQAEGLRVQTVEQALALTGEQRYAAVLILDALAAAMQTRAKDSHQAGSGAARSGTMEP